MLNEPDLERLSIATPCPKRWSELDGDDVRRFCETCSLHVQNLSAMTRADAEEFLEASSGRVCVTYLPKAGGGVATREDLAVQSPPRRAWLRTAASFFFGLLTVLPGCRPASSQVPSPGDDQPGDSGGCEPPEPGTELPEDLRILGGLGYVMGEAVMSEPVHLDPSAAPE